MIIYNNYIIIVINNNDYIKLYNLLIYYINIIILNAL